MIRTFNRAPITVDTPSSSQVKQYFFNQQNWKGVIDNKNFLTADQESFSDSKNVYVNEEGLLKSRPSMKLKKDNVTRAWEFTDTKVYYDAGDFEIICKGQSYIYKTRTFLTTIKIIKFGHRLLIFSKDIINAKDTLLAFNIEDCAYETIEKFVHIPETKAFAENSESKVLDKNELSDSEIYSYLYNVVNESDKFVSKVHKSIYDNDVYIIDDDDVRHYFKFTVVSENSILETLDLKNIVFDEFNTRLTYSDIDTALLFDRTSQKLYYSVDGRTFTQLIVDLEHTLLDATISKDGYCIGILTTAQAYIKNIFTGTEWTPLLENETYNNAKVPNLGHALTRTHSYTVDCVESNRYAFAEGDLISVFDSTCFAILETKKSIIKSGSSELTYETDISYLLYHKDDTNTYFALNLASFFYDSNSSKYVIAGTDRVKDHGYGDSYVYSFAKLDISSSTDGVVCAVLLNSIRLQNYKPGIGNENNYIQQDYFTSPIVIVSSETEIEKLPADIFDFIDKHHIQRNNNLEIFFAGGQMQNAFSTSTVNLPFYHRLKYVYRPDNYEFVYGRDCAILGTTAVFAANAGFDVKVSKWTRDYTNDRKYSSSTTVFYQESLKSCAPLLVTSDDILYTGKTLRDTAYMFDVCTYQSLYTFTTLVRRSNKVVFIRQYSPNETIVKTNAISSVKVLYKEVNFDSGHTAKFKPITPDTFTENDKLYLSKGSKLYISYHAKNDELYFPEIQTMSFADDITGLHPISSKETAVFFENAIYYSVFDTQTTSGVYDGVFRYYKTKLSTGLLKNSDAITTFDGKYVVFPTHRGLAAMTYQDFVASEEQSLTYLSDSIYFRFKEFIKDGQIKLFKYSFWIIVYKVNCEKFLLLDLRNGSWWPLESFFKISEVVGIDVPKFSSGSALYEFDSENTSYFDSNGSKISWSIRSQKLHFGAPNYYKHISNITFTSVHDESSLGNVQSSNFKLKVTNYRQRANGPVDDQDYTIVNYDVNSARTHVLRLNYSKVNEFEYELSYDENNVIDIPLSLSSIIVKYKISNQVR